ncbi:MAG: 50S ribosomal protein L1 [bacterium]
MPVKTKKAKERQKLLPRKESCTPEEALGALKKACAEVPRNFDETVEASVRLGIDPKKPEQQIRGTIELPHGTGRVPKVLVFAAGDHAKEAEDAGADHVGGDDLVEKIQGGWLDFDVAISTPEMMRSVGKLGKILGPRKLMPNPKSGTVTFQVGEAVKGFKRGKLEYRSDSFGIVHIPIGKVSFEEKKLVENFTALIQTLLKIKPAAAKGQYLRGAAVSSTMGPGLKISLSSLTK